MFTSRCKPQSCEAEKARTSPCLLGVMYLPGMLYTYHIASGGPLEQTQTQNSTTPHSFQPFHQCFIKRFPRVYGYASVLLKFAMTFQRHKCTGLSVDVHIRNSCLVATLAEKFSHNIVWNSFIVCGPIFLKLPKKFRQIQNFQHIYPEGNIRKKFRIIQARIWPFLRKSY